MGTRAANRTSLMIPWSRFPLMPVEMLSAMPPQGLSVRLPRVANYFSLRVRDESDDVRMRYDAAFMIEWARSVETALTLETRAIVAFGRVVYRLARSHVYYPQPSLKDRATSSSNARHRKNALLAFQITRFQPGIPIRHVANRWRQIVITDA